MSAEERAGVLAQMLRLARVASDSILVTKDRNMRNELARSLARFDGMIVDLRVRWNIPSTVSI